MNCSTEFCTFDADPLGTCIYEDLVCADLLGCTEAIECQPTVGCIFVPLNPTTDPCEIECEEDVDCNDDWICSVEFCDEGICNVFAVNCDDSDPCTVDWCNPYTGSCVHEDDPSCITDEEPCTDEYCNSIADACAPGFCMPVINQCAFIPIICDDGNICTEDSCDPELGCVYTVIEDCAGCETALDCDDGNICTADYCQEASDISKEDPIYMEDGFEHPDKYCTYKAICSPCHEDDECIEVVNTNPCVVSATCNTDIGFCDLVPVDCDDGNPCTENSCDMSTIDCIEAPLPDCCEVAEACVATDICTGTMCDQENMECLFPPYLCDDYNPCTADSCHPQTGECTHVQSEDCNTQCEKSQDCSLLLYNSCVNACEAGDQVCLDACWDGVSFDNCAIHVCDIDMNTGIGSCAGSTALCNDGNECTLDSCDVLTGCTFYPDMACASECELDEDCLVGSNACTSGTCVDGTCSLSQVNCDDGDPCTLDSCDNATGNCTNELCPGCACDLCTDDDDCNDGSICTEDQCLSTGACIHLEKQCNDGDICTNDICDPQSGCIHVLNDKCLGCFLNLDCNDENLCTLDTCGEDRYCQHEYICE